MGVIVAGTDGVASGVAVGVTVIVELELLAGSAGVDVDAIIGVGVGAGSFVALGVALSIWIVGCGTVGEGVAVEGAGVQSPQASGKVTSLSPVSGVPMPSVVVVTVADGVGEGPTASEGVLLAGGGFSVTEESEQPQNNAPASKHTSKKARPSKNVFRFFKLFKLFKIYTSPNKKLRV